MTRCFPSDAPASPSGRREPAPRRTRRALPLFLAAGLASFCAFLPLAAQETTYPDGAFDALEWRSIGPYRGGRAVAVAGVLTDPETYYMGSTGGGVWKTTDGGEVWENVSDGYFGTGSVGAVAVAPSDPNVVFAGTGEHPVRGVTTSHGDGVYRSTDAGRTWTHLGLEETRHISRIRIHPDDPDRIYVAAQGPVHGPSESRGIYRSEDGGATWEKVLYVGETAGASALSMDRTNPRILYAGFWDHLRRPWEVRSGGEGSGIWKSTDGGDTWEEIGDGLPELVGKIGVDVSPANPDRVYAIVEAEPGEGGLYRSDDAGESWEHVSADRVIQARSWYYMKVFAHPRDENTVIVLNAPVNRSVDGGRSWEQVSVGHGDTHDLWIHPLDPDRMALADDGGAEITTNAGESWSTLHNQPTAQFYRVNADRQFPYHVYGGQQDNSAIGIRSAAPGGIGWKDFYSVAGCESAYLAFDPDDPRFVYGNCYQGLLDRWDRETRRSKPIQPYPFLGLGVDPIDQPYRFNWNAPVVADPHDPETIYFAGNVVFRTRDRGRSWEEISPDLTRNEPEKQRAGGRPITNEAAGGENYNTIMYVEPSPEEEGLLWVGSDDGLVHLTRDGGESWREVTPSGLAEGMVNSIEASPHDPATAYFAFTRYKFDDRTPHVYRTTDYGETWSRVVDGMDDPDAWVRVVREDPEREGLLYAGTELGMYLSFDAGASWRKWQLDLPVVPVTDLMVHRGDLIAATQGRGFWILDELAPVRQMSPEAASAGLHLFRVDPIPRVTWSGGGARAGENPTDGVPIHFMLGEAPDTLLTLTVQDAAGQVVRRYATDPDAAAEGPEDAAKIEELDGLEAGMNRVVWDFRHQDLTTVEGLQTYGSTAGRMATPGAYRILLEMGGTTATSDVRLLADPRWDATQAQFREQDEVVRRAKAMADELYSAVNRVRDVRDELGALVERAREGEEGDTVADLGEALRDDLEAWEETVVQPEQETFQDVINFRNKLDAQILHLAGSVDGTVPPVTEPSRRRLDDLESEWRERRDALDRLLRRVEDLDALARERGLPHVSSGS